MTCLFGSLLLAKADIYEEYSVDNVKTGQKRMGWTYSKTISCNAKPFVVAMSRVDFEKFSIKEHEMKNAIMLTSHEKVPLDAKITNIVIDGTTLWEEPGGEPTVFEVRGYDPMIDPFGNISGWRMGCSRSADQVIRQ